ncbi:hypothetical protein DXG01_006223 [Tephrocybe rancida]|nr:hypothetical protein DXG01_006223 [Tephrocybe rancida]
MGPLGLELRSMNMNMNEACKTPLTSFPSSQSHTRPSLPTPPTKTVPPAPPPLLAFGHPDYSHHHPPPTGSLAPPFARLSLVSPAVGLRQGRDN